MADIKPADNKNRSRRLLLLSLLAVAVIATSAVMTTVKPNAPEYRRYVGPPLPDGSRVTFLYPANLTHFPLNKSVIGPSVVQDEQLVKPPSLHGSTLLISLFWKRGQLADDLAAGVVVTDMTKLPYGSFSFIRKTRGRFETHSVSPFDGPGNVHIDAVDVVDARHRRFSFQYQYLASSAPSPAFVQREATITNSFQVLPPGAAVPTP